MSTDKPTTGKISRRAVLTGVGVAAGATIAGLLPAKGRAPQSGGYEEPGHAGMHDMAVVGECEPKTVEQAERFLTHFDWGRETRLPNGRTLREYDFVAEDVEIEIAPGLYFPAWTYNGQVPGPTIRARYGDRIRINFSNAGSHPHTMHFHGYHPESMDGSMPMDYVEPGGTFLYEFDAEPYGLHLYHCHSVPLKRHIHKGLYGTYIVDPPTPRPPAKELVMVMNGFDTNFDGDNEVYAVNTVAHHHMRHPIHVKVGELVRIYLVNVTEFDPVNSFHLHANFFYEYKTGTRLEADHFTDTVMMCQGERSILEITFPRPGQFMFHGHQSEFAELGWMGLFDVSEGS